MYMRIKTNKTTKGYKTLRTIKKLTLRSETKKLYLFMSQIMYQN